MDPIGGGTAERRVGVGDAAGVGVLRAGPDGAPGVGG
jgi:hypothetical protein